MYMIYPQVAFSGFQMEIFCQFRLVVVNNHDLLIWKIKSITFNLDFHPFDFPVQQLLNVSLLMYMYEFGTFAK